MLLAGGGAGDADRAGLFTINHNFIGNYGDKVFGSASVLSPISIVYYLIEIKEEINVDIG